MLAHHWNAPANPARTVILGAGGFVGQAAARHMEAAGAPVLRLGRTELDLLAEGAAAKLAAVLDPSDALVVVSARAPCKNGAMLEENIRMMNAVAGALAVQPVAHLVYVSSDAVYADYDRPMTERDAVAPTALHGAMHLARELMLKDAAGQTPFAVLRPTLIYGPGDPHNGYGPNRFARLVQTGEDIVLFGEGEERRDHIHIDDVGALVAMTVRQRSEGILNLATGIVTSFRDIAEALAKMGGEPVEVKGSPRKGPMPHHGYRAFDITAIGQAFPGFVPRLLMDGLAGLMARHG